MYAELLETTGFKVIECYEKIASVNAPNLEELKSKYS